MTGVRLRPEGFEGRCDACGEWWPIEREFWESNSGFRRCRPCVRERRVLQAKQRREYNREWMRRSRARARAREYDSVVGVSDKLNTATMRDGAARGAYSTEGRAAAFSPGVRR